MAYQILFCVVMLIVSSVKHKDDQNEIIRKAKDLISKTKTLKMLHIFFAVVARLMLLNLMGMAM